MAMIDDGQRPLPALTWRSQPIGDVRRLGGTQGARLLGAALPSGSAQLQEINRDRPLRAVEVDVAEHPSAEGPVLALLPSSMLGLSVASGGF